MIHLITYGNFRYEESKKRLCSEAEETGWFDSITSYGPEDLDNNFKISFENILNQDRGGGYWIWKPYLIKKQLEKINDNDVLIYLDSGCSINKNGKKRLDEYIEILKNGDYGCISFQMNHLLEKTWTTKEIFKQFNVEEDGEIANAGQIVSGIQIIIKNPKSIKLVNTWNETLYENPLLFTDHYRDQHSYFIENRHDQSVFSVIRKINSMNTAFLTDETWFTPFGNEESLKCPFWACRIK